jgi:SM-20-related protein
MPPYRILALRQAREGFFPIDPDQSIGPEKPVPSADKLGHEDVLLNLAALQQARVTTEPFPHIAVSGVLDPDSLSLVSRDFPAISRPGVFSLSDLDYGEAFARLIADIDGPELEALLEEKFGLTLSDKPLMITVRGQCQKKDGRIHTDSKDKLLTCLLYLNESHWDDQGGRLRLLRNGQDLNDLIAEIPPLGGNFVAFQRTDISWHGHEKFEGQRRYVMFNWLRSDLALAKNLGRHKLSAAFKKLGFNDAY